MMNRLKTLLMTFLVLTSVGTFAVPSLVFADDSASKTAACDGLAQTGDDTCSTDGKGIINAVKAVITVLSTIIGIVAVVMVIVSGFKYITSGGDAGKVGSAKSTLIYALVGVFVAALAQVLVHYVIFTSGNATSTDPVCRTNHSIKASSDKCK